MLAKIDLADMTSQTLERALQPFPSPVRTLDGLHLATAAYLKAGEPALLFASYDKRMLACAQALGIGTYPL